MSRTAAVEKPLSISSLVRASAHKNARIIARPSVCLEMVLKKCPRKCRDGLPVQSVTTHTELRRVEQEYTMVAATANQRNTWRCCWLAITARSSCLQPDSVRPKSRRAIESSVGIRLAGRLRWVPREGHEGRHGCAAPMLFSFRQRLCLTSQRADANI